MEVGPSVSSDLPEGLQKIRPMIQSYIVESAPHDIPAQCINIASGRVCHRGLQNDWAVTQQPPNSDLPAQRPAGLLSRAAHTLLNTKVTWVMATHGFWYQNLLV